jgi:hypothetical protein
MHPERTCIRHPIAHRQLEGPLPALPQTLWAADFSANSFAGPLPPLEGLSHLEVLLVGGNALSGTLPTLPKTLATLDASYNRLMGALGLIRGLAGHSVMDGQAAAPRVAPPKSMIPTG